MESDQQLKQNQRIINQKKRKINEEINSIIGKQITDKKQKPTLTNQAKPISQNPSKEQLIGQYLFLRTVLKQLSVKIDQTMSVLSHKKAKKVDLEQPDQRMVELKKQIRIQQLKYLKNKNIIQDLKLKLQNIYDVNKMNQLQNELREVAMDWNNQKNEQQSLIKIKKNQEKALTRFSKNFDQQGYNNFLNQVNKLNSQNKQIKESINKKEKELLKLHESYRYKVERIRDIDEKFTKKKQIITKQEMHLLERKHQALMEEKKLLSQKYMHQLKKEEIDKNQLQYEIKKCHTLLEQKKNNFRLQEMMLKNIKILIQQEEKIKSIICSTGKQQVSYNLRIIQKKGRNKCNLFNKKNQNSQFQHEIDKLLNILPQQQNNELLSNQIKNLNELILPMSKNSNSFSLNQKRLLQEKQIATNNYQMSSQQYQQQDFD